MTTRHSGKVWNEIHRDRVESFKQAIEAGEAADLSQAVAGLTELTGSCRSYLARSFDERQKSDCAHFHYTWLLDRLGPAHVRKMIVSDVEIWRLEREGAYWVAFVRFEHWVAREGELTLEMRAGDTVVCLISFNVAPGRLFGLAAGAAILVSRVQGNAGQFELIRQATKAMSDVAPRAALFAALAGVAKAIGVGHVVGVAADNHPSLAADNREILERQYDDFFRALDAEPLEGGFYALDLHAPAKPLTLQKTGHRVRTRKKRLLKQQIAESVAQNWASQFPPPAGGDAF